INIHDLPGFTLGIEALTRFIDNFLFSFCAVACFAVFIAFRYRKMSGLSGYIIFFKDSKPDAVYFPAKKVIVLPVLKVEVDMDIHILPAGLLQRHPEMANNISFKECTRPDVIKKVRPELL
ncbi:hypothetical protein Q4R88_19720, partial [Morganella morganii]